MKQFMKGFGLMPQQCRDVFMAKRLRKNPSSAARPLGQKEKTMITYAGEQSCQIMAEFLSHALRASVRVFAFAMLASTALTFQAQADLFVTSWYPGRVLRYDENTGHYLGATLLTNSAGVPLDSADGLVFGKDGNLYVASWDGNQILRLDGKTGAFMDAFATNVLAHPLGLTAGKDGNLYVCSWGSRSIVVIDGDTGQFLRSFGETKLSDPRDSRFGPDGLIYVADYSAGVVRFDAATGAFVDVFCPPTNLSPGSAYGLTFGVDGNLFISVVGDMGGGVLRVNGSSGEVMGNFAAGNGLWTPVGVAFGRDGALYVVSNDYDGASHGGVQGVLRYDGVTGAFVDLFALDGLTEEWGLQNLVFSPSPSGPGQVIPWGGIWNGYTNAQAFVPVGLTNVTAISSGYSYAMALLRDQTAVTWGQLPGTFPSGLSNVVAVSGGGGAGMLLQSDGRVTAFGHNLWGQLNVPSNLTNVAAISAGGYFCAALLKDGTVSAWGNGGYGSPEAVPAGLKDVAAISAGAHHCLALRSNGMVVAWGYNGHLQTSVPEGLTNVVAVAAGFAHSMALRRDGTVSVWGGQLGAEQGQEVVPPGLSNVVAIAAGPDHNLALRTDGTVVAWGRNDYGQSSVPVGLSNVVAISGGTLFSLALNGGATGGFAPRICSESGSQIVQPDTTASFAITAMGTSPLSYQWRFNGTNLPNGSRLGGVASNVLTINNVLPSDAGRYSAVVSNAIGSVTSSVAVLLVNLGSNGPPAGEGQKMVWDAARGEIVMVTCTDVNETWAWRGAGWVKKNAVHRPPPRSHPGLAYDSLRQQMILFGGFYGPTADHLEDTWAWNGSDWSQLSPSHNAPGRRSPRIVFDEARSETVFFGGNVGIALSQDTWIWNGVDWLERSPAARPEERFLNNLAYDALHAEVVLFGGSKVGSGMGSFNDTWVWNGSNWFKRPPASDNPPQLSASVLVYDSVRQEMVMFGGYSSESGSDVNCQTWIWNGTSWTRKYPATVPSPRMHHAAAFDPWRRVVVMFGGKNPATLEYNAETWLWDGTNWSLSTPAPPEIITGPTSQTVLLGANADLCAGAAGSDPLTYQWQHQGTNIPGATSNCFHLPCTTIKQAGAYSVVVSNGFGVAASFEALLSVVPVVRWGDTRFGLPNVPLSLTNAVAVSGGGAHNVALKADGTVVAWGDNSYYGQTNVPLGLTNVMAISAGNGHTLALRKDGTVVAWGANDCKQSSVPLGLGNVVAIAAAGTHSLALKADGTVAAWGDNTYRQTTVPADLASVVAIAARGGHNLALKSDGTVVAWGLNNHGETSVPMGLSNVVAIAAGAEHSLALNRDGTIVAWGSDAQRQCDMPVGLSNVVAIAGGTYHSMALKADGTVAVWGYNGFGQTNVPVWLTNVLAISAGDAQCMALVDDGSPTVTIQPLSQAAYHGDTIYLTSVWKGPVAPCYQWLFNSIPIPGASSAFLTLSNIRPDQAGSYSVVVSNALGSVTSDVATLTVNIPVCVPPLSGLVAWWPGNGTASDLIGTNNATMHNGAAFADGRVGQALSFDGVNDYVSVPDSPAWNLGTGDFTMELWTKLNRIKSSMFIQQQSGADGGGFEFYYGHYSTPILALNRDSTINLIFRPWTPESNRWYHLAVVRAQQTYQLYVDGLPLGAAEINSSTVPDVAGPLRIGSWTGVGHELDGFLDEIRIYQRALNSNEIAGIYAARGEGMCMPWPTIKTQPLSQGVEAGASGVLSASVEGLAPIRYQWFVNGMALPGATNASLVLSNMTWQQNGAYTLLASNAQGMATSAVAVVEARLPSSVVEWGGDLFGETDVPSGLHEVVAIAAGVNHMLALQRDGSVVAWGSDSDGQCDLPAGLANVIAVAAGGAHSLALRKDGTVVAWGLDEDGQTEVPPGLTNAVAIAAGDAHSLALRSDGTVVGWGANNAGQCSVPDGLTNVVAIAGGGDYSLALRADGTVSAWGYYESAAGYAPMAVPVELSGVVAISAGYFHALALKRDGTVVAWGDDSSGQTELPPGLTNVVAIAAGYAHSLALREDGTVAAWGWDESLQTEVPAELSKVVGVAAGQHHSAALTSLGAPQLPVQPSSQTVVLGTTNQLRVRVLAAGTTGLQWLFNGAILPGATNGTLDLPNVGLDQVGNYMVIASNAYGMVTSQVAQLVVQAPPSLDSLPSALSVAVGTNITLTIEATGLPPFFYQWRKNNVNLPGATNRSYAITDVQVSDAGSYDVVVANAAGAASSNPLLLLVEVPSQAPPEDDFANRRLLTGPNGYASGANLNATREAGEPYHATKYGSNSVWYAWQAPASGIATFSTEGSAFDTLLAVYTNDLTLDPQPSIANLVPVASDDDRGGYLASRVAFNVVAGAEYAIAVDGFVGQQGTFILGWDLRSVPEPLPVITGQPASQTLLAGEDAFLAVTAVGSGLSYQWHFNGAAMAGETNVVLALHNLQGSKVGFYTVAISNRAGVGIESLSAVVEIGPVPDLQSQGKLGDTLAGSELSGGKRASPQRSRDPATASTAILVGAGTIDSQIINNSQVTPSPDNHCGFIYNAARWLVLKTYSAGTMIVDTKGSAIDTVLAVHRQTTASLDMVEVACSASPRGAKSSVAKFKVLAGEVFWVAVDGLDRAEGEIHVNWALGHPPEVRNVLTNAVVIKGQGLNLRALVTNSVPAAICQWLLNDQPIAQATNATLTLENVQAAKAGLYSVQASNIFGSVIAPVAWVDLEPVLDTAVQSLLAKDQEGWCWGTSSSNSLHSDGAWKAGGYVQVRSKRAGELWWWVAPSTFLGNKASAYGGVLQFDLKQSINPCPTNRPVVLLSGAGGLELRFPCSIPAGTNWTSYRVPLRESQGWRRTKDNLQPLRQEMIQVLGNLLSLQIQGQFKTTNQTYDLDNMVFLAPVSCPEASAVLAIRVQKDPPLLVLEWTADAQCYQLEVTDNLAAGHWTNATTLTSQLFGSRQRVTLTVPGTSCFFRLRKP